MRTCLRAAAAITLAITVAVSGSSARQITQAAVERPSYCEDDSLDVAGIPVDEMQQLAQPTDKQRAALDELGNASVQAAQIVKASCPTEISSTTVGRIDALQQRVQAMLKAVNLEQPALAKFYDLLTDEQKARLNALTQKPPTPASQSNAVATAASPTAGCGNRTIPDWPPARILRDVHPTPMQRTLLNAMQDAATKARANLQVSCSTVMPVTPPARLSAIEQRLQAILTAIGTVRGPLNDFYGSLSDKQKAQFNMIGRPRASKRG
jgi:nucleotide-binding universal stress UspA family protein